jgi:uncharacterized protein YecE (DUF72 family)
LYEHWRERFYAPSARGLELEAFSARFDTVELNVTFYRMPQAATFRSWAGRVPPGFIFAVKASRYVTHTLRLREPAEPVAFLLQRAAELGSHLGPVLLQLPPDMSIDLGRLSATLDAFPRTIKVAVEPRHASWYTEGFRRLLERHGAALCLADRRGPLMPLWRTTEWGYLRFHGGRARPASCYSAAAITKSAESIHQMWGTNSTVYAYFNNDHAGCALRDAARLGRDLEQRGVAVGRVPDVPEGVVLPPATGFKAV